MLKQITKKVHQCVASATYMDQLQMNKPEVKCIVMQFTE